MGRAMFRCRTCLLALLAPGALIAPAAHAAAQVTRVLPIGDSITQGGNGHASWRYRLWFTLSRFQPVDFVGTRRELFGGDGPTNPVASRYPFYWSAFDRDHEAYWGWRATAIEPRVHAAAIATQPDVVLVMVGTNDLGLDGAAGVPLAAAALGRIIDDVRAARPAARVYVGLPLPISPSSGFAGGAPHVPALHQAYAAVVQSKQHPAAPLVLVDATFGFEPHVDMQPDGIHPNQAGEQHVADAWLRALWLTWTPPPPPVRPQPVLVDPSFEAIPLADGQWRERPEHGPWRFGATGAAAMGVHDPSSALYFGAGGEGTPSGAQGSQALYLRDFDAATGTLAAFQTLATTFDPARSYILTVAVGRRLPVGGVFGGFRIELLAGNTVIGSIEDTLVPVAGTFADATLHVARNHAPVGLAGTALTVRLSLTATAGEVATDFDSVRLLSH